MNQQPFLPNDDWPLGKRVLWLIILIVLYIAITNLPCCSAKGAEMKGAQRQVWLANQTFVYTRTLTLTWTYTVPGSAWKLDHFNVRTTTNLFLVRTSWTIAGVTTNSQIALTIPRDVNVLHLFCVEEVCRGATK